MSWLWWCGHDKIDGESVQVHTHSSSDLNLRYFLRFSEFQGSNGVRELRVVIPLKQEFAIESFAEKFSSPLNLTCSLQVSWTVIVHRHRVAALLELPGFFLRVYDLEEWLGLCRVRLESETRKVKHWQDIQPLLDNLWRYHLIWLSYIKPRFDMVRRFWGEIWPFSFSNREWRLQERDDVLLERGAFVQRKSRIEEFPKYTTRNTLVCHHTQTQRTLTKGSHTLMCISLPNIWRKMSRMNTNRSTL